jgi:hypothetical protein
MIDRILARVPEWDTFLTVDELNASSQRLAEEHPEVARFETIGRSTSGDPIPMLRIGIGEKQLLFFACPHPNEPIGAMTLESLAKLLVEDDELRGDTYTWNLVKCIDPDGTRLNEGWFKGPFTVTHYASNFYRPGATQQAEWTFPVTYKNYSFFRPIPETQALMTAITALRPTFIYSLHNAGMGGGYFYLTPHVPDVDDTLRSLVTDRGIPLALGEPEMPWGVQLSPAIFKTPRVSDHYDFLEKNIEEDPATKLKMGAGSYDFASGVCDPAHLIVELPYFFDPRTADTSPDAGTRREAILSGVERSLEIITFLSETLESIRDQLTEPTRLRDSSLEIVGMMASNLESKRAWASKAPELDVPVTAAQKFDSAIAFRFYQLLFVGMVHRAIQAQIDVKGSEALSSALRTVEARFAEWAEEMESDLDYKVIPIKTLVEIQLGAALHFIRAQES